MRAPRVPAARCGAAHPRGAHPDDLAAVRPAAKAWRAVAAPHSFGRPDARPSTLVPTPN
ncbi:hypothetical protein PSCLAVI8L_150156 [Pseudoclavibacter sp. 8L]|nr:hypothetical protein PSCLAVI8L_150156 [Pseudoclavibacter sp. 8L]